MSTEDIKRALQVAPIAIEGIEAIAKAAHVSDNAESVLGVVRALAAVALDAMSRTISPSEARAQIARLMAGTPQAAAKAAGRAEVDKLFGDDLGDDTEKGGH